MIAKIRDLSVRFRAFEDKIWVSSQKSPVDRVLELHDVHCGETKVIGFTNPFSFQIISATSTLMNEIDYWYSDGAMLCRTVSLGRSKSIRRYSFDFSSIADHIFRAAEKNSISVALLGGTQAEIISASDYISKRYPSLKISFAHNGYFRCTSSPTSEHIQIFDNLLSCSPGIIIVGMGTPLQEEVALVLKRHVKLLDDKPLAIFTCGGFLSQTASGGDYYPKFIKMTGLRWVYRAINEPHVRRRLMKDYPLFAARVIACNIYRVLARVRTH